MKLIIEQETKVEDVKRFFIYCYPFLKIKLYKKSYAENYTALKKEPMAAGANLFKNIHPTGNAVIDINADITVEELENQFDDIGLIAEVFRKSGNVWVETSLTNNWTLQQQNAEAEEISSLFKDKIIPLDTS